jgi:hypothetical protein
MPVLKNFVNMQHLFHEFVHSWGSLLQRIKAVLIVGVTDQMKWPESVKRIQTHGNRHVEVTVFKWTGRGFREKINRNEGHTIINLPGPVCKDANQKDLSWLNYVGSASGDPSDGDRKWKMDSADHFLRYLKKAGDLAARNGRSVWLLIRPLDRVMFPPGSNRLAVLSHWGIMISDFQKGQLMDWMNGKPSSHDKWGDLHELRNNVGQAIYECNDFKAVNHHKSMKFTYLGETEMNNDDLHRYGI